MLKKEVIEYIRQFRDEDKESFPGDAVAHMIELLYNRMVKLNNQYFAKYGTTFEQFDVLAVIIYLTGDKGLSQLELSRRLCVSQGNITRIVDRMMKQGLVTKAPWEDDRRYNIVSPTKKGMDLFNEVNPGFKKLVSGYCKNIKEYQKLKEFLMKWLYDLREG
ncbi:DNA-binding MarR family transcriptional regulator [Elusimicrobium posterum]|uniref:MarR family winged helix-turn-helix transcriptional regulator n=1 Tax=Elusimicrobium posterum TaxID=3116653 RepID=UPI003C76B144